MGWDRLVAVAGAVVAALMIATGAARGDIESLLLGGAFGVAVTLAYVFPRLRVLLHAGLALLFANVLFWMATAAVANVRSGEGLGDVAVPVVLSVASVVGVAAALASVVDRRRPVRGATAVAAAAVVVVAAALVTSQVAGGDGVRIQPGDVRVDTGNMVFEPERLELAAGAITVVSRNDDLFWHTFTIDELDIDLRVPVGAARRRTFTASSGTYEYYCAIPGHRSLGMEGVLVVRSGP